MEAITLKNVTAGYGSGDVLKGVSFYVEEGRATTLMGANGSGKTTLLRVLTGLLPYKGEVQILGHDLSKMKRREIAGYMALMSQLSPVYFSYTVRETVELGRYIRQKTFGAGLHDREVVDRCIETTGLSGMQERQISTLSGGQLQRVFLARTLAQETPIILLDEPTNHLDLKYQAELISYLTDWSKEATTLENGETHPNTLVGVFHDIALAAQVSEDMIFLKQGEVLKKGPKKEILTAPLLEQVYDIDVAGYYAHQLRELAALHIPNEG